MNEKYDMDPVKREQIRDFSDIMLRLMFFCCKGDWQHIHREATRYNFMWQMWIEPVYSYMSPPEPEYRREIIAPRWFTEWQERHP